MDRTYRAHDKVSVHQSSKDDPVLDTFAQQPYIHHGYCDYMYRGRMYCGYVDMSKREMPTYILLDHPVTTGY